MCIAVARVRRAGANVFRAAHRRECAQGTLEPGLLADIVACRQDPLEIRVFDVLGREQEILPDQEILRDLYRYRGVDTRTCATLVDPSSETADIGGASCSCPPRGVPLASEPRN
jgi:hypothetical protein